MISVASLFSQPSNNRIVEPVYATLPGLRGSLHTLLRIWAGAVAAGGTAS
jgi:hypothetical protein